MAAETEKEVKKKKQKIHQITFKKKNFFCIGMTAARMILDQTGNKVLSKIVRNKKNIHRILLMVSMYLECCCDDPWPWKPSECSRLCKRSQFYSWKGTVKIA